MDCRGNFRKSQEPDHTSLPLPPTCPKRAALIPRQEQRGAPRKKPAIRTLRQNPLSQVFGGTLATARAKFAAIRTRPMATVLQSPLWRAGLTSQLNYSGEPDRPSVTTTRRFTLTGSLSHWRGMPKGREPVRPRRISDTGTRGRRSRPLGKDP